MVMVEGLATSLDPTINMWDVAAPFVRSWIRDELGPEAFLAERLRTDVDTLLRLPALVRRIEERYPPKGGAPEQAPLPKVELLWSRKRRANRWPGYAAAAMGGGLAVWVLSLAGLLS
jgi:ubiquinone biosynthesis protein